MPRYKLTYFDIRGRAEISRLIFAAAEIEYEDIRYPWDPPTWPQLREKLAPPFGTLPILEVDSVKLCQSISIARFLARKYGLAGKNDEEQFRADMIVDCCEDITNPVIAFMFHEPDSALQAAKRKVYVGKTLPFYLKRLEDILMENNGGDGFFVGSNLTWADFGLLNVINWMNFIGAVNQLANYPKLAALNNRVRQLPKIAAWLDKRPPGDV